uniref:Uncharacterized protein n=1 Tax=Physcomitrium patens TaxID=3218 RepID=A0A2K1KWD6_PHYPA|nr:hypothetical protein PHYPA_005100 [Physcomitrium patens]
MMPYNFYQPQKHTHIHTATMEVKRDLGSTGEAARLGSSNLRGAWPPIYQQQLKGRGRHNWVCPNQLPRISRSKSHAGHGDIHAYVTSPQILLTSEQIRRGGDFPE